MAPYTGKPSTKGVVPQPSEYFDSYGRAARPHTGPRDGPNRRAIKFLPDVPTMIELGYLRQAITEVLPKFSVGLASAPTFAPCRFLPHEANLD
jgi:hypothetical protein